MTLQETLQENIDFWKEREQVELNMAKQSRKAWKRAEKQLEKLTTQKSF
jgi:hypothetical protein